MKNKALLAVASLFSLIAYGQKLDQVSLPVNTTNMQIGLISNVNVGALAALNNGQIGLRTSQSALYYQFKKSSGKIIFEVPGASELLATGLNTKTRSKNKVEWSFDAQQENQYKFYIATASDSAKNYIVYSGYLHFPSINKWKLIASFKINGKTESIGNTNAFKSPNVVTNIEALFTDIWSQGDNGSWNKVQNTGMLKPILPPFSDIDSAKRAEKDIAIIDNAIKKNETDAINIKKGLYYTLMKPSNSNDFIKITDTVTIFYKGYLMGTDIVFDQTANEPRTFPLGRLIKGWQVGLEGTRVGEKVKLLIPSGLAYSIRTRSPMIPPNSILVFEIEMVDTKHVKNNN